MGHDCFAVAHFTGYINFPDPGFSACVCFVYGQCAPNPVKPHNISDVGKKNLIKRGSRGCSASLRGLCLTWEGVGAHELEAKESRTLWAGGVAHTYCLCNASLGWLEHTRQEICFQYYRDCFCFCNTQRNKIQHYCGDSLRTVSGWRQDVRSTIKLFILPLFKPVVWPIRE